MASFIPRFLRQLLDVDTDGVADGDALIYDDATEKWVPGEVAATGAPATVDYLVGTGSGDLSSEIVVGTSPGGELGGTWASPTVDATHSGSSHASIQAAAEATAASELSTHSSDTTGVHGIADTSALALTSGVPSNATFNDHSARHEDGGADEISIQGLAGTPVELTNHLTDTADAHDASAISVLDTAGDYTATDVEGVLAEIAPQLGGGGGSGEALVLDVAQTAHGLDVGDWVRLDGSGDYIVAQADTVENAEVIGVVIAEADANNFTLAVGGYVTVLSGLTVGAAHFLSGTVAGTITDEDTANISKPVLVADTDESGWLFNMRGFAAGGSADSGGDELLYVERTTNLSVAATTYPGAETWIAGSALDFDGSTRIKVEAFVPAMAASAGGFAQVTLWDGATDLGVITGSGTNTGDAAYGVRYFTPSAGSHTYTLKALKGGTSTLYAGSGGTSGQYLPAFFRITEADTTSGGGSSGAAEIATGWIAAGETWTYASATTFTVTGDQTVKYSKGTRIKLTQTTAKYFVVVGSSHSAGTTTVTITGGTDYTLANAAITSPFYSYMANPQGYPTWFNFTPANITGWTTPTTTGCRFQVTGRTVFLMVSIDGTSNSTAVTFDAPVPTDSTTVPFIPIVVYNNGVAATGRIYWNTTTQLKAGPSAASDTWTGSGGKSVLVTTFYGI